MSLSVHEDDPTPCQKELLLSQDSRSDPIASDSSNIKVFRDNQQWSFHRYLGPSFILHSLLILAYTIICIAFVLHQRNRPSGQIYSPARDALSYTSKMISVLYNDTANPFLNAPSKDLDQAWYTLLQNMNVRLRAEEISRLGRNSIKLGDGSGDSLGSLDVYHQLHCVKYLRHFVEGVPLPAMRVSHKDHANHCIELIRQVLVCHGDVAVVTYDWLPKDPVPMPRWEIEHECVDWNKLDSWALKRRVSVSEEGMIVHPELGASYPAEEE